MQIESMLARLRSLGKPNIATTIRRHGAQGDVLGVLYSDMEKLKKEIGKDQVLAAGLWKSGVHEARVVATMVGDGAAMSAKELDQWAKALDSHVIADAFGCLVVGSEHARAKAEAWTASSSEWLGRAGWHVRCMLLTNGDASEDECTRWLAEIEKGVHSAKNRVKQAMMGALIGIGTRSDAFEKKALAAAKRIGKIEIDHGDTDCKTPDIATYLPKARAHAKAKAAKAATKATAKKKPATSSRG